MSKYLLFLIIGVLPFNPVFAKETQQLTQESRKAIKMLGSELKKTLKTSMKAKGPVESIAVCNTEAPLIANKVSNTNNMTVRRTSLRYRNPANKPDVWEEAVLDQFEQRKLQGELVKSLEFSDITELNGQKVFRYMKAIPTAAICVKCHGSNIPQPVANKINHLYPNDLATGFKAGDIRGAFSVIQIID